MLNPGLAKTRLAHGHLWAGESQMAACNLCSGEVAAGLSHELGPLFLSGVCQQDSPALWPLGEGFSLQFKVPCRGHCKRAPLRPLAAKSLLLLWIFL